MGIVAAALILFTLMINVYQPVAEAVNEIPILSSLSSILVINQEIKYALKHDYIQKVDKKVFWDNTWSYLDFSKDGLVPLEGERYFTIEVSNGDKLCDDITISFINIVNMEYEVGKEPDVMCEGNFNFNIGLKNKITEVKPEEYVMNNYYDTVKGSIYIKEMKIFPMSIEINIDREFITDNKIHSYENWYLQDETGNRYLWERTDSSGDNTKLIFHGGAFHEAEEMYFYIDGCCIKVK